MHNYYTISKLQIQLYTSGICIDPDIFQELMSALMGNLESVRAYLDNFLVITSGSFEEHLAKVEEIMKQLQSAGLKCNIYNCKFLVPKLEYLRYIITRKGIKLDPKKTKAIINLGRSKDKKQVR